MITLAAVALVARQSAAQEPSAQQWTDLRTLLVATDAAFRDRDAREAAAGAVPVATIEEALRWSGQEGYLVSVRLQTPMGDTTRATLLGMPLLLGVGPTLETAVTASLARGQSGVSPAAGFRFAPERSFYVWATIQKRRFLRDRVVFAKVTPAGSAALDRTAELTLTSPTDAGALLARRRLSILGGIALRFAEETGDRGARARVDSALAAYRTAYETLVAARTDRDVGREAVQQAIQAAELVRQYRRVLGVSALREQAVSVLRRAPRAELVRLWTIEELLRWIESYRSERQATADRAAERLATLTAAERLALDGFFATLTLPADLRVRVRELL